MDLSIVILNWNTRDDTRNCLASIFGQTHRHNIEVIVVDNASEDGSREMLASEFPQVRLVVNSTNLGFGAGNNRAIPAASGRFLLFLNSDTIVTTDAFDRMLDFADADPGIGIIGPKLLNGDGSLQYSCRHFPNMGTGFFRNTPLGRLFPQNRFTQDYLMRGWDHSAPREVDWVSGAALMIRRETLEAIGGFDEDYYFFCEDVDMCWRVHETGRRVVYFPLAVIYHIIGRSTDKVPTRMTYEFHKSMYLFYRKHYAHRTSLLLRPFILPGIIARASGQIVRYRWRHLKHHMRRGGR